MLIIAQGKEVMHRSCTYKRNQINLHASSSLPRPTPRMDSSKMYIPGHPTPAGALKVVSNMHKVHTEIWSLP